MPDIILYPRDTVLRALEVMHRYGVHLLPVVDERHGDVLGHVAEEELVPHLVHAPAGPHV